MNKVEVSHLEGTTKVSGQEENAQESEPGMSHISGSESGSTTPQESQTLAIEPSGSRGLADRKATGPRTELGKQRASRNATKHGVFSKVVVLKGESRAEYEKLLAGLREALEPEGALEGLLVEKLATIEWRYRRLLLAEGAEIRKNTEFVESDQRDQEREAAGRIWRSSLLGGQGLIGKTHNRHVLERCIESLAFLRKGIEDFGFRPDQDASILRKFYGDRSVPRLSSDLYDFCETCRRFAETPEEERERKGYPSPAECRQILLKEIDKEIRRLKRDLKARGSLEATRTQLEIVRRNVPDAPGLDPLLRYQVSLERSFDRTLSQLERQQRMRRGQLVPPPLKVEISR